MAGGRPTKADRERKRVEALLAEGKGPNGEPIEEGKIISETKNQPPPKISSNNPNEINIGKLDGMIEEATLGKGAEDHSSANNSTDQTIENSDFSKPDSTNPEFIKTEGHDRFKEDIIENDSDANKAANNGKSAADSQSNTNNPPPPKDFAEPIIQGTSPAADANPEDKKEEKKSVNPEFDKLSPTEQREQIELFAEVILTNYAQMMPLIPTLICSYNMDKMQLLDKDGIIRLSMTIKRTDDGQLTLRQHMENYNIEVSETFVITTDMKEELRPALIAVLQERGTAPTPMMSLLIGVGRHTLMFIIGAYKMRQKKNSDMEEFKEFRKQELEMERERHIQSQTKQPAEQQSAKQEPVEVKKEATMVSMSDAIAADKPNTVTSIVKKSDQGPEVSNDGVTIEDVLNNEP